ncbi:MAG: DUF2330 domain-containing protein [Fimbriimonadaceae bacterium]
MRLRTGFFLGFGASCAAAVACSCVTIDGKLVEMMDQKNIIVWDPESKTEHFIRDATFKTDASDLGFIAPTPSVPKMEEVDPAAFDVITAAIVEFERLWTEEHRKQGYKAGATAAAASTVEVIQAANVAGFEAVTVKASDAGGLGTWMKTHGFVSTPSVQTWTEFYIKKKWYLTLFRVSATLGGAKTGLVKLSFKTDQPFNPYYVPSGNIGKHAGEGLLVYFVGPGTYEAMTVPANNLTFYSATPLTDAYAKDLQKHLKLSSLPPKTTVSLFRDTGFPRAGVTDDVYFKQSGPQPVFPPQSDSDGSAEGGLTLGKVLGGLLIVIVALIAIKLSLSRSK